jgi:HEAT repeat protein
MLTSYLFLGLLLPAAGQETPQVPGAYRGPDQERTLGLDAELAASPLLQLAQRRAGWEAWFEHERELLFRGEPDFPARAVREDGRYGTSDWAVKREELLLTALPLLIEALTEKDPALREAAAIALGRVGYPASQSLLVRTLDDAAPSVRQAACLGLGLLATDDAEQALRGLFEDGAQDPVTRGFAALGLGLSGRVGGGSAMKIHLNAVIAEREQVLDPVLTQAVVIAAGVHGSRDFVPLLLELDERLAADGGAAATRLRGSLFQALGGLQDERAEAMLTAALEREKGDLARSAAQALARIRSASSVNALAAKARVSHDPEAVALCLIAIGRIGGNRALEELKRLQPDGGAEDSVQAAWLLASGLARSEPAYARMQKVLDLGVHGKESVRAQNASVKRGEETVRSAAAVGLGLFRNPQSFTMLDRLLDEAESMDPAFVGYAATALGMLQTQESEERLLDLATISDALAPEARRGLAIGLGLCSTERSAIELARLLVRDPSAEVRWAGARALSYARSNDALRVIVEQLRACIELQQVPESAAHLVLGLGFLGDLHQGATLDGLVAGMDFLQESRLLETLRAY